ncbi:hypothetical protein C8J57DRAFT_1366401 [Mycena rebaudengoi]|nr:hypothetical protein C8J57DRAFT_1366401 [Mycena rebaudengoi]
MRLGTCTPSTLLSGGAANPLCLRWTFIPSLSGGWVTRTVPNPLWTFTPSPNATPGTPPRPRWTSTPSLSANARRPSAHHRATPPRPRPTNEWRLAGLPLTQTLTPNALTLTPTQTPSARRPPTSRTLTLCSSSCSTRSSPRTPRSGRRSGTASARSPQDGRRRRDFLRGATPASTPPSTPSARAPRCSARRASASSTSARASSCGVRGSG